MLFFVFFKQKTAYEMRISDWSSDVCSSDLHVAMLCDVVTGLEFDDENFPACWFHVRNGTDPSEETRSVDRRSESLTPLGEYTDPGEIGRASCRERVCQYV